VRTSKSCDADTTLGVVCQHRVEGAESEIWFWRQLVRGGLGDRLLKEVKE
jgi:hypothetical protein